MRDALDICHQAPLWAVVHEEGQVTVEPIDRRIEQGALCPSDALWVGPMSAGIPEPVRQLQSRHRCWQRLAEQGWTAGAWTTSGAADPRRRATDPFRPPKPARPYSWAPLGHFLVRPHRFPERFLEQLDTARSADATAGRLELISTLPGRLGWPIFCDPQLQMDAHGALVYYRERAPLRPPMWLSGLSCLLFESPPS